MKISGQDGAARLAVLLCEGKPQALCSPQRGNFQTPKVCPGLEAGKPSKRSRDFMKTSTCGYAVLMKTSQSQNTRQRSARRDRLLMTRQRAAARGCTDAVQAKKAVQIRTGSLHPSPETLTKGGETKPPEGPNPEGSGRSKASKSSSFG